MFKNKRIDFLCVCVQKSTKKKQEWAWDTSISVLCIHVCYLLCIRSALRHKRGTRIERSSKGELEWIWEKTCAAAKLWRTHLVPRLIALASCARDPVIRCITLSFFLRPWELPSSSGAASNWSYLRRIRSGRILGNEKEIITFFFHSILLLRV